MSKEQPTQEQKKEFWEWCGLRWTSRWTHQYPQGYWTYLDNYVHIEPPTLDLNNLFKYAVPKLHYLSLEFGNTSQAYLAQTALTITDKLKAKKDVDPALALFWAIWKVIHG
jgi:hypothetical protein